MLVEHLIGVSGVQGAARLKSQSGSGWPHATESAPSSGKPESTSKSNSFGKLPQSEPGDKLH
jgi:hypothetical protein